jgi:hypothetical protein
LTAAPDFLICCAEFSVPAQQRRETLRAFTASSSMSGPEACRCAIKAALPKKAAR